MSKREKKIRTRADKKAAQQLAAERKQREADRARRDTERATKRLSMRTKIAEQKKQAPDSLFRLYQFAYKSMTDPGSINPAQIKEEWDSVAECFQNEIDAPDSMESLLTAIRQILSLLSGIRQDTNTHSDDNVLGQKLHKLCADDQVDEALMLIWRYKLKDDNHSALAICKYNVQNAHNEFGGWGYHGTRKDSFQYAIEHVYPRFLDNKTESNQHDEYEYSMRRLFLFKMLLKEGASLYGLLEGKIPRLETVWGTYWKSIARCKDGDAVDLIFECGAGIHDVNHKEGTKDRSRKCKQYTVWTPIQEAILQRNVPLMKHLLNAGAKSNGYFMWFFFHEEMSPVRALYPTAMCAFLNVWSDYLEWNSDGNEMVKCFLKHCDPKVNGFPNVNHYCLSHHTVPIPKAPTPPPPPPKEEDVPNIHPDDDSDDETEDEEDYYDSDEGLSP